MSIAPSHFTTVILFAIFASTIFGITQRSTPKAVVRYGAYCFALFLGAVIVASWVMYFIPTSAHRLYLQSDDGFYTSRRAMGGPHPRISCEVRRR